MDSGTYQKWIEDIDALSEAQRKEVQAVGDPPDDGGLADPGYARQQ